MKIYNDTTGKVILKELVKTMVLCSCFMIIVLLGVYFMADTRPTSIIELLHRMEMPYAISEIEIESTYSLLAFPLAIFIMIFLVHTAILLRHYQPPKTNIKAVDLLRDTVTFYFTDKSPALTFPYEAIRDIQVNIHCLTYQNPLVRITQNITLSRINILFNFHNDKNLEVTNLTFKFCPMSFMRKIINASRDKYKFSYRITGIDTELMTSYSERIDHYLNYSYKRFCARNEKGSLIFTSWCIALLGSALVLISMTHFSSHRIKTGEWTLLGIGTLVALCSFYIDWLLIRDEIFDHKTNSVQLAIAWIIPIIKILLLISTLWWILKTNYYI